MNKGSGRRLSLTLISASTVYSFLNGLGVTLRVTASPFSIYLQLIDRLSLSFPFTFANLQWKSILKRCTIEKEMKVSETTTQRRAIHAKISFFSSWT